MNKPLATLCLTALSLASSLISAAAENPSAAAQAVNALGLDLLAKGTEAAAATAVVMARATAFIENPKPIEVRVDRPFLFAIQHRPSGACLFLGRVTDPR